MTMVAEIKKAILRTVSGKGRGYISDQISEEGIRAVAELVVEGLIREDDSDSGSGMLALVITRKGLDAAVNLHV
jgi:hypothetical protein